MNLSFRCKHKELGCEVRVKEPLLPVTLFGKNELALNFIAILDSGSDLILLPLEVAEELGLEYDKSKQESATTISGDKIMTLNSKVKVAIQKDREKQEFECLCAVLASKEPLHENIIFGSSFFEHFKIIFDYPNNRFQIKR